MSNKPELYVCRLDDLPCYPSSLIVVFKDCGFRGGKGCTQGKIGTATIYLQDGGFARQEIVCVTVGETVKKHNK